MPTPVTAGMHIHISWCLVLGVHHVFECCTGNVAAQGTSAAQGMWLG